jgi:hypothetical protein
MFESSIIANFLVVNGEKVGNIIPYIANSSDLLQKNLNINCKLEYDEKHRSIFILGDNITINGIKKLKGVLKDGDIIEIDGIKLRFYFEDFNSIFKTSDLYSDLFYNESPFFKKEVMFIILKNEYLKLKRYNVSFAIIFIKFVDIFLFNIRDILTNILKENLRETDFISDISDNDLLIFLPFLEEESTKNVLNRILDEITRLVHDVKIMSNFINLNKNNISKYDSFIKVMCELFNI